VFPAARGFKDIVINNNTSFCRSQ